jgi:hypothetical protein
MLLELAPSHHNGQRHVLTRALNGTRAEHSSKYRVSCACRRHQRCQCRKRRLRYVTAFLRSSQTNRYLSAACCVGSQTQSTIGCREISVRHLLAVRLRAGCRTECGGSFGRGSAARRASGYSTLSHNRRIASLLNFSSATFSWAAGSRPTSRAIGTVGQTVTSGAAPAGVTNSATSIPAFFPRLDAPGLSLVRAAGIGSRPGDE